MTRRSRRPEAGAMIRPTWRSFARIRTFSPREAKWKQPARACKPPEDRACPISTCPCRTERRVPPGENFWEAGATLALPLFDRNQGGIEEAAALLQRAEEGLRAAEGALRAQLAFVRAEQVALSTELDALSSSIAPAASRALSQAGDGYLAGRVTLLDLIDAQRTLADAKIRTLEVLRELRKADAELASLAGLGAYQQRGNHP